MMEFNQPIDRKPYKFKRYPLFFVLLFLLLVLSLETVYFYFFVNTQNDKNPEETVAHQNTDYGQFDTGQVSEKIDYIGTNEVNKELLQGGQKIVKVENPNRNFADQSAYSFWGIVTEIDKVNRVVTLEVESEETKIGLKVKILYKSGYLKDNEIKKLDVFDVLKKGDELRIYAAIESGDMGFYEAVDVVEIL